MSGITLDQFKVFSAIVETGSFAAAARQLNRTQSAVTYTIQKLEEQTGMALFDREHYRPKLTKSGQSLLPHAQKIMATVTSYRTHAESMVRGLEASVSIALSQFAPNASLIKLLADFQTRFPTVRVGISTITVQTTEKLDNGSADLALLPEFIPLGSTYRRASCGAVPIVAVASPDHPLAALKGKIPVEAMEAHSQIITSGRDIPDLRRNYAVQSLNYWQVNDLETKRLLILGGVGWGGIPEHMVTNHLADGTLVRLDPVTWDGLDHMPELNIVFAYRQDKPLGPAAQWLFDQLSATMLSGNHYNI
ncbi:MAG: LysR family transcriptional regulator [Thalassospira sp.]|uniref:LysR family transcriptional regulator n=1 Tax=Thalassospira sp. TaxID=1912094 RepID=UPI0032EF30EA